MAAKWSLFCSATGQLHDACVCGSCLAQCPRPPPEVGSGSEPEELEVMEPEVEVIDLVSKREVEALIDLEPEAEVIDLELEVELIDLELEVELIDLEPKEVIDLLI
jgi:hypothetical protein